MGKIDNYKIEIIQRTKEILESEYPTFEEKDREVTFLMNCLLGLIIAISEGDNDSKRVLRGKIDNEFLSLIPNKVGFLNSINVTDDLTNASFNEVVVNVQHYDNLTNKDKLWFITKLRNGIAHQNIQGINENNRWIGVRIWNENKQIKDFEIIFQIAELKNFALKLAEMFLQN